MMDGHWPTSYQGRGNCSFACVWIPSSRIDALQPADIKSKTSGGDMDVDCTRVIAKNMTHCVPVSQKSDRVKEAYFHLHLNLFENMKTVPKICFAFLSFKDNSTLTQKNWIFSNLQKFVVMKGSSNKGISEWGYGPVLLATVRTQGNRWCLLQRTGNKNKK